MLATLALRRLSQLTVAGIKTAIKLGLDSLRAEAYQRLGDWARDNFRMAGESSHQKGAWEAWSMQVGILDFMSDDRIQELFMAKAKRVGFTKMVTAAVCYFIAHRRRKLALWQPTDDDRDSYVKSEIDPVFDEIDAMRRARKQGSATQDTIKFKVFRDCVAHFLGGKAARAYRRITVAVVILDEWSAFDQSIEKSGDPEGLSKGRLEGAAFPKFIGGSTLRFKGIDPVERACANALGMVRFHIECPHCRAEHPLTWGGKDKPHGFKWTNGDPTTVRHICPHCHQPITQADYLQGGVPMPGTWVCEKTGKRYGPDRTWRTHLGAPCDPPRTLGLHIWSAYSPQRSWPSIVEEFLKAVAALAAGDAGPMQLFVNETLGETWELQGDRSDEHALQARAEAYPLCTIPAGALILTAGIDVQRNRWEISIWGWGRGMESWLIAHHILEGNPASEEDWEQVTLCLQRRYIQQWHTRGTIGLSAISIDSSDQTQAVYNWCRQNAHRLPMLRPIKGSSEDHKPILGPASGQEVSWRGNKWPNGVKLWSIGVDTAKDLLLGQLAILTPGPGFVHFSADTPREWFEQLTAEQRILVRLGGKDTYKWVRRRPRNEALDCRNYALHAAYGLGLHAYTDRRWTALENALQPATSDLFATPTLAQPITVSQEHPQDPKNAPETPPIPKSWATPPQPGPKTARAIPRGW